MKLGKMSGPLREASANVSRREGKDFPAHNGTKNIERKKRTASLDNAWAKSGRGRKSSRGGRCLDIKKVIPAHRTLGSGTLELGEKDQMTRRRGFFDELEEKPEEVKGEE